MGLWARAATRITDWRRQVVYDKTTACEPRHNDVYLVEFPKSGVTWLSALIGNTALRASGRSERASYTSVHFYVPDIHVTRHVGCMPYCTPPVRFIKSHAVFNPNYTTVIYLVRHPVALMKSWYRYQRDLGLAVGDFDAFCRSQCWGVDRWRSHVSSWLTGRDVPQRLHLCRYEDLCRQPAAEIAAIYENFGWPLAPEALQYAVDECSVRNMQADEASYRARNPRYSMCFVKGGDIEISPETESYIVRRCAQELRLLGYNQ